MGELWSANNLGAVEKSGWGGWEEEDEEVLLDQLNLVSDGAPTYTSLDQNKLFVSESLAPLTQFANGYKEPTIQFLEL